MRLKNKILCSLKQVKADGKTVIIGTVMVFLAGILSRILSGSPIYMLRLCGLIGKIPKAWVFTLIWSLWYLILGFLFGFVLGSRRVGREVPKYKGSLWFVCMMLFNIVWYPLFFKSGTVSLALVDLAIIILFCFLCSVEYYKVYKIAGILLSIHLIWLLWCFYINLKVFLSI